MKRTWIAKIETDTEISFVSAKTATALLDKLWRTRGIAGFTTRQVQNDVRRNGKCSINNETVISVSRS